MEKDRNFLVNMYNATSTGDENDELESYEAWLEKQLLRRVNADKWTDMPETPKKKMVCIVYCPDYSPDGYEVAAFCAGKFNHSVQGDNIHEYVERWKPLREIDE